MMMMWVDTTTSYRRVCASIGDDETGGSDVCGPGVQHYDQSGKIGGRERERERKRETHKGLCVAVVYWSLPHRGVRFRIF
jgi:hypothetical protein